MSKVNEKLVVAEVYKEVDGEMFFMGFLTEGEENNSLDKVLEDLGYKIVARQMF